jgi:hypothetical protein
MKFLYGALGLAMITLVIVERKGEHRWPFRSPRQ